MSSTVQANVQALRHALLTGANPGGGWGYYPGKASRLEATCWALLALLADGNPQPDWPIEPHRQFLLRCQASDGLLAEEAGRSPNLAFNGLAALTIAQHRGLAAETARRNLLGAIVQVKGIRWSASPLQRQDNRLQAWPWIDETFSWLEPTVWCLLALKKATGDRSDSAVAARVRPRIDEAERLIVDRCCRTGGWNYGTSNVLGQELRPYIPTTAMALLAMQDRRDHPAVVRSLDFLRRNWSSESSGMALALTLICFRVYGLPVQDAESRLWEQDAATRFLGNVHITAMALYGLTGALHGAAAFRV